MYKRQVVREASTRVLGMTPFKVQIIGGIALHGGNIAEMRTGEGKTLTSTMPAYLNALSGKGVHIITVNEYLASRDAREMGELYRWLGLTVGLNLVGMSSEEKKAQYACDITVSYTHLMFGFMTLWLRRVILICVGNLHRKKQEHRLPNLITAFHQQLQVLRRLMVK